MASISVQGVTKQLGQRVVLDKLSVELHSGVRVGIVGPNGAGKTTLFRLIAGQIAADFGTVTRSRGMRLGYLPQEPQVGLTNTLHDEVLSVFADVLVLERRLHEIGERMSANPEADELERLMKQYDRVNTEFIAAGGYDYEQRLNEILGGLGFSESDAKLPMSALSGGQKCRAALARLLLEDSTYLLLDEPTNHLDIDAVQWLERFLAGHRGGAAIISHDRYLLDRLAERILEVDRAGIESFPGNYSNYVRTRHQRRLTQQRQHTKDREYIEKERAFIAKHIAGQRTKEAQGRRTRLERRIRAGEFVLENPAQKQNVKFEFQCERLSGRTVVETSELSKRYDEKMLFRDFSIEIQAGQRVGITGPNGVGKTTLLRAVVGQIPVDAGNVEINPKARLGYFAQEADDLDPHASVLSSLRDSRPDLDETQARSLLGAFQFRGEDVYKKNGSLSGGEQSRLRLLNLILTSPNVLVLDEPTNHLDVASRESLEAALDGYPGTLIVVSHDRYFLDRIADRLVVLRPDGHRVWMGNYSAYRAQLERETAAPSSEKPQSGKRTPKSRPRPVSEKKSRFDRMTLEELEAAIGGLETRVAEMHARFATADVYRDPAAIAALREQFEQTQAELGEAEAAWLRHGEHA